MLEFERQALSLHRVKLIPCPASASSASSTFRAICDCKMYWTCGFCKHERIVLHLESQLDLDKMNSELRVMRKSGPKRKAASALQRQPPSPAKKKKGAAAAAESLPKRRKK